MVPDGNRRRPPSARRVPGTWHLFAGPGGGGGFAHVDLLVPRELRQHGIRDVGQGGNDFFAMDEYPEIRFESTAAEKVDDTNFRLTGDLTIKGVTNPVTVPFEYTGAAVDPWGKQRVGFEGAVTVNRKDWGVTWNAALEAGGVLVSEKVTLEFELAAVKAD